MVDRRAFLSLLGQLTAGVAVMSRSHAEETPRKKDRLGEWMPARRLGRTGEDVTMLGMGGYHFGVGQDKDGQAILETALENGLRFVDCATEYQ
ncbi:MAG: aldo/keto reductase, partial [bacterium]|nr:aldo/keto reductase [bacterium]